MASGKPSLMESYRFVKGVYYTQRTGEARANSGGAQSRSERLHIPRGPGDTGTSSAALKAFEGALKRSLPPTANG